MGWSVTETICRKHPNQKPQPGVCPSCLRERLSEIAAGNYSRSLIPINYCSSSNCAASPAINYHCYSDTACSSGGGDSPMSRRRGGGHQRVASDVMDSIYWGISRNISNGLKKSRSIANYSWRNVNGERDKKNGERDKKKGGLWNKLLLLRSSTRKRSNKF